MTMYLLCVYLLLPLLASGQGAHRGSYVLLPDSKQPQKWHHIGLALGVAPAPDDADGRPQFQLVTQHLSDCGMVVDVYTGHYTQQGNKLVLHPMLHGWPGSAQTMGRGGSVQYIGAPFRCVLSKSKTQLTLRMGQGSMQLVAEKQTAKQ